MTQRSIDHVLILGAGPVGLFIGSLLRDQGVHVTIVEKREANTRTRCVKLLGQTLSLDRPLDEISVFSDREIEERRKAINSLKLDLFTKTIGWLEVFTPIQQIQEELRTYYTLSGGTIFTGPQYDISKNLDSLRNYQNTIVIDCTGYHSVLRNNISPNNFVDYFVEYVLVCTFIYKGRYECNELCKYYKNLHTKKYKIIPAVDDTYIAGGGQTHVTCLITIEKECYDQLSKIKPITYEHLKTNQRELFDDLNIFLINISGGRLKKIYFNTMEFITQSLKLYRSKKLTHTVEDDDLNQHWLLLGDAAMGGPYFQAISMGFEAAIYFAYLFKRMNGNVKEMLQKYEEYLSRLWLLLQIRTREVQRNKQILEALYADSPDAILKLIKIY